MAVMVVGDDLRMKKHKSCHNCSARLEYTLADTATETIGDYTGDRETIRTIVCPRCSFKLVVPLY